MKHGNGMASNCIKLVSKLGENRVNSPKIKFGGGHTDSMVVLEEEKYVTKKYSDN
jgi:hypothetical protein